MAPLSLYNSPSKRREPFSPLTPGKVRIYNCGPTVYKRQHIGNMRRFLFSDFLRRTLELSGYEVREITNITDVGHLTQDDLDSGEDKLDKAAKEEKTTPEAIANKQLDLFMQDVQALGIKPAHLYPRASHHIPEMQALISILIDKKHAYVTDSGVYFDVPSFPSYGRLSGNTIEKLEAGKRIAVREDKHHPADFALWKFDNTHLQQWDSPWGVGYPGWHIECSAMSIKYLDTTIDIHTGGEDNKFPHHENEIAQSEAAYGVPFVRFWLHNAHLQLSGQKMAKREGDQITLDTLVEKGYSPLAFRLLVFGSHYRSKMDFSWKALDDATLQLHALKNLLRRIPTTRSTEAPDQKYIDSFENALANDLNTPEALAVLLEYIRHANTLLDTNKDDLTIPKQIATTLQIMDTVLGVIAPLENERAQEHIPAEIQALVEQREDARKQKQFERADDLRKELEIQGYTVEDTASGPRIIGK